jgi:hypothetical protein
MLPLALKQFMLLRSSKDAQLRMRVSTHVPLPLY